MRIALINQTFYPDVVSTAQHLADLARHLAQRGHEVTVIASRRGYDHPDRLFPSAEEWRGVSIRRVANTGFGKGAKWKRAANFATFLVSCAWRMVRLPRQDVVVALTSPPLVSVLAAGFARLRGARFCYWIMDLNPDEALAAGWLSPGSLAARLLERLSRFSLRQASAVVVLDRFMEQRVLAKGIEPSKVFVLPPWSHDAEVRFDDEGRARFRKAHGLEDKFVVMYAGNHSPCHSLETVLAAAQQLSGHDDIRFCFVGGGSEWKKIKEMRSAEDEATRPRDHGTTGPRDDEAGEERRTSNFEHRTSNVELGGKSPSTLNPQPSTNLLCLPYQPLDQLGATLSAADAHLVVMGERFVGLVHPCKLYNILRVGAPLIYIGPTPSHVSDLLDRCRTWPYAQVNHGQVEELVQSVLDLKRTAAAPGRQTAFPLAAEFAKEALLPRLVELLGGLGAAQPIQASERLAAKADTLKCCKRDHGTTGLRTTD